MPLLNPFLYGKPVPPARFVGRQDAARTLFSRLRNGESSAVVGEPHIGKSSLLRYVGDPSVQTQWLGDLTPYLVSEMDCHLLPRDFTPAQFWHEALATLPQAVSDERVLQQWRVVTDNQFGAFTLEKFFQLLGRAGRRVVLIIDEFDTLLNHPQFKGEFFGSLRSFATRTDGLSVVAASRLSVGRMNRVSQELNPLGSPFFNNVIEVRLLPLSLAECRMLIDTTLAPTGVAFDADDYNAIHRLAGRHPFLVQIAAAGLFDAISAGLSGDARAATASQLFHAHAAAHFEDFWQHLSTMEQATLTTLVLGELKGRADGRAFDGNDFERMSELTHLYEAGIVEQADETTGVEWQGAHWRVAARGFVRWLSDNLVSGARDTVRFDQWLRDTEGQQLLTRAEATKLQALVAAIRAQSGGINAADLHLSAGRNIVGRDEVTININLPPASSSAS